MLPAGGTYSCLCPVWLGPGDVCLQLWAFLVQETPAFQNCSGHVGIQVYSSNSGRWQDNLL